MCGIWPIVPRLSSLVPRVFSSLAEYLPETPTSRIGQLAVDCPETAEEAARSPECFVDNLIDDDKISRSDILAKRSHGGAAYNCTDTEFFESENVRRKRHLAGRERVSVAVTA